VLCTISRRKEIPYLAVDSSLSLQSDTSEAVPRQSEVDEEQKTISGKISMPKTWKYLLEMISSIMNDSNGPAG